MRRNNDILIGNIERQTVPFGPSLGCLIKFVLIQLRVRIGIQPFSDLNHRLFEDATTAFAVPASKRIPHYDSFYTASTSATTEPSDISAHILSTGKNKPVSKLLASQINECVIFPHDYV
jgi:hypothetical protein